MTDHGPPTIKELRRQVMAAEYAGRLTFLCNDVIDRLEAAESEMDGARMLTTVEVAEFLAVNEHTVYTWRAAGTGPKFIKLNNSRNTLVRYRQSDLMAWLDECQRDKTGER